MIKRYVRFAVKGYSEGERGKFTAVETGVCDARLDPLQVAMKRNGKLAMCEKFVIKRCPAFSVAVEGSRSKTKEDV